MRARWLNLRLLVVLFAFFAISNCLADTVTCTDPPGPTGSRFALPPPPPNNSTGKIAADGGYSVTAGYTFDSVSMQSTDPNGVYQSLDCRASQVDHSWTISISGLSPGTYKVKFTLQTTHFANNEMLIAFTYWPGPTGLVTKDVVVPKP